MQVNVAGLRRNLKNIAHNYSEAQKKVREATSNDPWGPNSRLMAEIADLTYNVVAFTEIMQMIWKRLNDHGRNWRHVYKALVLLEYLIKTGTEKVGQQCKENIFAIQTLKDFQYLEEGKDQGQNVREKTRQLVTLLNDEERMRNERARALKAKERFAQSASGFGSDGGLDTPGTPKFPTWGGATSTSRDSLPDLPKDLELARPQTAGEEELQLQLALAMSREEADQEEQKKRSDDVRLQLALSQSQQDFKDNRHDKFSRETNRSHALDLLEINTGNNSTGTDIGWGETMVMGMPQPPSSTHRPHGDAWYAKGTVSPQPADPWQPNHAAETWSGARGGAAAPVAAPSRADPWSPTSPGSSTDLDDFDVITNRNRHSPSSKTNGTNGTHAPDPFELNLLGESMTGAAAHALGDSGATTTTKRTPQSFLGDNAALVNLDNLVTSTKQTNAVVVPANPFSDPQPPKPTINQIKQAPFAPAQFAPSPTRTPPPLHPHPPQTAAYGAFNNGHASAATATLTNDPWAPLNAASAGNVAWGKQQEEQHQQQPNPFLA